MAQRTHGWLPVGDGHRLYFEWWGNGNPEHPILYLHGGPGGGFTDSHKLLFDENRHRVLFFDQRGAGRSKPSGSLKNNTTEALIEDIDKLLEHFELGGINIIGGSWGSTLALAYAIHSPLRVGKMLLSGIFLGTRHELDFLLKGHVRTHFPEAWSRFTSFVPPAYKANPEPFYADKILKNSKDSDRFAREWVLYESSLSALDIDPRAVEKSFDNDDRYKAMAKIEAHYFKHDCFLPDGHILKHAARLKHIPTTIIQGRFDFVCSPRQAYRLHQALPGSHLRFTLGGHSRNDTVTREVVKTYLEEW